MPIQPRYFQKKLRRAKVGLASQDVVALWAQAMAEDIGLDMDILSKATYGQKGNDVWASIDGTPFGIEVKGVKGLVKPIPIFDKSVRRRNVPEEVETITRAYIDNLSIGGGKLKRLMTSNKYSPDFLGMLDFFRDNVDSTVGLAEDANSASSGKLPKELSTSDSFILDAARTLILSSLKGGKDSYFAVHDKNVDDVLLYFTGYGKNQLQAPKFPRLKKVVLDTYGGASKGATRIAFKITL